MTPKRVLVLSWDPVVGDLRGPAIRYLAVTDLLRAQGHEVRLLAPTRIGGDPDVNRLRAAANWCDTLIAPRVTPSLLRSLRRAAFIWDAYVPTPFEAVRMGQRSAVTHARADALLAAATCDAALVAGSHQTPLVHGMLLGASASAADRLVRGQLPVVKLPFGTDLAAGAPLSAPTDVVRVLWFGGLWPWLDWEAAVRAVNLLHSQQQQRWTLTLPPLGPHAANELVQDAVRQGTVELMTSWVKPDERMAVLRRHHIGLSLGAPGLENTYSWRTRSVDYAGAGLPVLGLAGDVLSERAAREGWGAAVTDTEPPTLASALLALAEPRGWLTRSECALAAGRALSWDAAGEELLALIPQLGPRPRRVTNASLTWTARKVGARLRL